MSQQLTPAGQFLRDEALVDSLTMLAVESLRACDRLLDAARKDGADWPAWREQFAELVGRWRVAFETSGDPRGELLFDAIGNLVASRGFTLHSWSEESRCAMEAVFKLTWELRLALVHEDPRRDLALYADVAVRYDVMHPRVLDDLARQLRAENGTLISFAHNSMQRAQPRPQPRAATAVTSDEPAVVLYAPKGPLDAGDVFRAFVDTGAAVRTNLDGERLDSDGAPWTVAVPVAAETAVREHAGTRDRVAAVVRWAAVALPGLTERTPLRAREYDKRWNLSGQMIRNRNSELRRAGQPPVSHERLRESLHLYHFGSVVEHFLPHFEELMHLRELNKSQRKTA